MARTLAEVEEELKYQSETDFPSNTFYQGAEKPCRFEAEVYNCVIRGEIPKQINGTYYRCMPDSQYAPLYEDDVFINGDGCIDAVRIENGHADFKQKFVRTEKFLIERAARKALFGKYRNRYTDDPRVKHKVHSTANTHIIYFENQLLALKEDSRPYAMDPDTLETKGLYDFYGKYKALTHTAHPKIDPITGELITMGYQAKGDATTDIVYYLFNKNGELLEECWFNAPYVGMMHDMAATDKWIIFCLPPLAAVPLEKLQEGHKHFAWDEEKPLMFGILPRRNPKPEDVKWFHYDNAFYGAWKSVIGTRLINLCYFIKPLTLLKIILHTILYISPLLLISSFLSSSHVTKGVELAAPGKLAAPNKIAAMAKKLPLNEREKHIKDHRRLERKVSGRSVN